MGVFYGFRAHVVHTQYPPNRRKELYPFHLFFLFCLSALAKQLTWETLPCTKRFFIPDSDHIDHALRVVVTPKSNDISGVPFEATSNSVVGVGPGVCPFESRHAFTKDFIDDPSM